MNKRLFLSIVLCTILLAMPFQHSKAQVKYMGTVELGMNTFITKNPNMNDNDTHFGGGLYTTHGVLMDFGLFVGAGVGVDGLMKDFTAAKDERGHKFSYVTGGIPVYGDIMLFPLMMAGNNSKVQIFIEGKVGNMFHIVSYNYERDTAMYSDKAYQMDKGLFTQAGFGMKSGDFKMSFNWTMHTLKESPQWWGSYDYTRQHLEATRVHGFSFNLGVAF